jgi:HEAT repeat protein
VARLIRAVPESAGLEMGLRIAYFGTMVAVAAVEALLVDELFMNGAFRLAVLKGKSARFARRDEDARSMAATMQRTTATFPVVLLACGVLTYLLFNLVNNDFDVYYRRVGKYVSALRGDDPESTQRRLDAIAALSIRREPEILPVLRQQLERGGEVGAWAAWAIGRHYDLPRRRPLQAPLVAASRGTDPMIRREALVALGRLQHRPMARRIQDEIQAQLDANEVIDTRLLYGLGAIQHMSSVPLLERVLHSGDEEAQRMAAWALAQHRDQRGGRAVVQIIEDRLPTASPLVRCAITHSLGILADESSNLALMRAYDETSQELRYTVCPTITVLMRPDREDDRIDLLMPQETFVMKVLKSMGQMRATTAEIRGQVEPWLEAVIADSETSPATREAAENLLSGVQQGRDDSKMKSVKQALDEAFDRE